MRSSASVHSASPGRADEAMDGAWAAWALSLAEMYKGVKHLWYTGIRQPGVRRKIPTRYNQVQIVHWNDSATHPHGLEGQSFHLGATHV